MTNQRKRSKWAPYLATPDYIVIRDLGPWDRYTTVTNDAENVVAELAPELKGRRLYYFDSDGRLDQIVIKDGRFAGFLAGGPEDMPGVSGDDVTRAPRAVKWDDSQLAGHCDGRIMARVDLVTRRWAHQLAGINAALRELEEGQLRELNGVRAEAGLIPLRWSDV